jgi:hypothetical protein
MVRGSIIGAALLVLTGCGGASGTSGAGGRGGGAGAAGTGGSAGASGPGGGTGAGGAGAKGGSSGGLPACAITTRPQDPVDTADGGFDDPRTHACNTIDPSGPWVVPEAFTWGDAGAVSDGGPPEAPMAGVVLDGDYDLVRILYPGPNPSKNPTRRTFRVFDGGTYIERAVLTQDPTADGGMTQYWYDTTEAPSGTSFGSQSVCAVVAAPDAYSADGDTLTLFVGQDAQDPSPIGIDIYRRTCTRP